jgi:hypothetical protein
MIMRAMDMRIGPRSTRTGLLGEDLSRCRPRVSRRGDNQTAAKAYFIVSEIYSEHHATRIGAQECEEPFCHKLHRKTLELRAKRVQTARFRPSLVTKWNLYLLLDLRREWREIHGVQGCICGGRGTELVAPNS